MHQIVQLGVPARQPGQETLDVRAMAIEQLAHGHPIARRAPVDDLAVRADSDGAFIASDTSP